MGRKKAAKEAFRAGRPERIVTTRNEGERDDYLHEIIASCQVRNQQFAVVIILRDNLKGSRLGLAPKEPLVRFYAGFDTEENAKAYLKHELGPHIGEYVGDIVDMYEWLSPEEADLKMVTQEYRDPDLSRIMQSQQAEYVRAQRFKEECRRRGKTVPDVLDRANANSVTVVEKDSFDPSKSNMRLMHAKKPWEREKERQGKQEKQSGESLCDRREHPAAGDTTGGLATAERLRQVIEEVKQP